MKFLVAVLALLFPIVVSAQVPWSTIMQIEDGSGAFNRTYFVGPPTQDALYKYNITTNIPEMLSLGTAGATVVAADTPADVRAAAGAYAQPTGTTAQYVRGDGSLATLPTVTAFNFGLPAAKTVAVSTAYQAADPSRAAVVKVSPQCTNVTSLLSSSACTLQVRQASSTPTCSTGIITDTWTSTVALGLVFQQTSGSPLTINLGTGQYFILCPSAGTFAITTAVEQIAG